MNPFDLTLDTLKQHFEVGFGQSEPIQGKETTFKLESIGFSSWQHAVEHCHRLSQYKQPPDVPLDDPYTLHIRCGTDIKPHFTPPDFVGDYLSLIDPLCMGPLSDNEGQHHLQRAHFIGKHLLPKVENGTQAQKEKEIQHQQRQALETLCSPRYRRRVFWLEHDNYDQLMWLEALTHFAKQQAIEIEYIEVNHFPGLKRFIGLGQLPRYAFRYLWREHKQPLQEQHITLAQQIWPAFCANTPKPLMALYQRDLASVFPNLQAVIKRHLQELPHCDSRLTKTQTIVIDILRQAIRPLTWPQLFNQWQQKDPLPYLGDTMLHACIKPLWPYLAIEHSSKETYYRLKSPKDNSFDIIPYSVGGIDLSATNHWSWDHNDLHSMVQTSLPNQ